MRGLSAEMAANLAIVGDSHRSQCFVRLLPAALERHEVRGIFLPGDDLEWQISRLLKKGFLCDLSLKRKKRTHK